MSTLTRRKQDVKISVGRPIKYDPAFNNQIEKLCKLGVIDKQLAEFLNISVSTLNEWKLKYVEFSESIKRGKMIADAEVAEMLFKRATGYSHSDVDIKVIDGKIVKTPIVKNYPPDTAAAIFWMKNRSKGLWRDKHDIEHTARSFSILNIDPLSSEPET